MGCSTSSLDKDEFLNNLIESIEKSLSFSNIQLTLFEVFVSETSFEKTMTRNQLTTLCRQLYLPLNSKELFLFHFLKDPENDDFSTVKVLTLIVLLGRGSKRRKKRILFQIYSFPNKNFLSFDDIKEMIANITEISIEHLLRFSMIYDKKVPQDEIEEFIKRMNSQKDALASYFSLMFFDGNENIQYHNFMEIFQKIELGALIKPKVIRMLSLWMFEAGGKFAVLDQDICDVISSKNILLLNHHY